MTSQPNTVGYERFATYISADASLQIYRRFATLNSRNLLYLQCALADLEDRMRRCSALLDDQTRGVNVWSIPRSWKAMKRAGEQAVEGQSEEGLAEMWELSQEMRSLLREYSMSECNCSYIA